MTAKEVSAINMFASSVAVCKVDRRKEMCANVRSVTGVDVLFPLLDITENCVDTPEELFLWFKDDIRDVFREFSRAGLAAISCNKHWKERKRRYS